MLGSYAPAFASSVNPGITSGKLWLSVTCQWNWLICAMLNTMTPTRPLSPHLDQTHGVKCTLDIFNREAKKTCSAFEIDVKEAIYALTSFEKCQA